MELLGFVAGALPGPLLDSTRMLRRASSSGNPSGREQNSTCRCMPLPPAHGVCSRHAAARQRQQPSQRMLTSLCAALRPCPPPTWPADTPLFFSDGSEPDQVLDEAVERLHNDFLDECTQMKEVYEKTGGDTSLGGWTGTGGRPRLKRSSSWRLGPSLIRRLR